MLSFIAFCVEVLRKCGKCNLLKPPRAHHCSVCGVCVMKMDHHCPSHGETVGSHNHRSWNYKIYWHAIKNCIIADHGPNDLIASCSCSCCCCCCCCCCSCCRRRSRGRRRLFDHFKLLRSGGKKCDLFASKGRLDYLSKQRIVNPLKALDKSVQAIMLPALLFAQWRSSQQKTKNTQSSWRFTESLLHDLLGDGWNWI